MITELMCCLLLRKLKFKLQPWEIIQEQGQCSVTCAGCEGFWKAARILLYPFHIDKTCLVNPVLSEWNKMLKTREWW